MEEVEDEDVVAVLEEVQDEEVVAVMEGVEEMITFLRQLKTNGSIQVLKDTDFRVAFSTSSVTWALFFVRATSADEQKYYRNYMSKSRQKATTCASKSTARQLAMRMHHVNYSTSATYTYNLHTWSMQ